jgi:hypothetical protein
VKTNLKTGGNVTEENHNDKWNRGLDLFIESVYKPDQELRQCAHNQKCYNELMSIRDHVLSYLKTLRH